MKNIFKLLIVLLTLLVTLSAENIDECKTDIYFGNGVWNSAKDAEANIRELHEKIINPFIIKDDPKLKAKYGQIKLQYNWGQGAMLDVLETYYQLREAGQVQDYQFYAVIALLTRGNPSLTLEAIASQKLMEPFTRDWEQGNADEMWQKYYDESFKLSHQVLLISHSQGNLFANKIYDTINPTEYKAYFANLQIASPASEVKAEKGDYVTLSTDLTSADPVINFIPGSMSPNASGESGHAFVSAYLSQEDPLNKITAKLKQLLSNLDTEPSQWQTDQELNKDTKDYKITVKHRFDFTINVMNNIEVYPFNASQKLYKVKDETGGNGWVKASCGGEEVFDYWNEQKDNQFYLINNSEMEKIMNKGFSFTIKYRLEFSTYHGDSWHRSLQYEYVKQNTTCNFYISGFGSNFNGAFSPNEEYYFNNVLPSERRNYDKYFIDFNQYNSLITCMVNEEGYAIGDIGSIIQGEGKKYILNFDGTHNYQQYFGYILEQEYIVNPKH